ncbi:MAG TPA: hypothetical protein VJN93_05460 [Candidatus Acidoferrum sp.]|nr:hypothetical protein [Candidatus Acidoferrum sp.]
MTSLSKYFCSLVPKIFAQRRWVAAIAGLILAAGASAFVLPNLFPFPDPAGLSATFSPNGAIDTSNAFFQSLGTNGRSCATCHVAGDDFGLRATTAQTRFEQTRGNDPLFTSVDGANCPDGSRHNPADHSLLLRHGLIRVALTLPSDAEFTISTEHDPYGCAIAVDPDSGSQTISVYRRPLPATNLRFLSAVMLDGRETIEPLSDPKTYHANLVIDLKHQALDATLGHAQAAVPPTDAQQTAIVNFEMGLYSGQLWNTRADLLSAGSGLGGPYLLSQQEYYPGVNDSLGQDPGGNGFRQNAFTLFRGWANASASEAGTPNRLSEEQEEARREIAAGETIFNSHPLTISEVRGLNDNPALGKIPVAPFQGTCTTCHDSPNVGNHSLPAPLDIGTGHSAAHEPDSAIANALSQLDLPDLPVYEIHGCPDPFAAPGDSKAQVLYTSDPGKALLTGKCSDLNRIKGPILRGLAARAPYFHSGAARNLGQVVEFYNQRFQMNLSEAEKAELVAFLNSL